MPCAHDDKAASASIWRAFKGIAEQYSDRVALKDDGGLGATYTYSELVTRVLAIAAGLRNRRLVDEAGIGLISENRPDWAIAYLAILAAGATVIPIDANLTAEEVGYILTDSGIRAAFASGRCVPLLSREESGLEVISFDSDSWSDLKAEDPITPPPVGNTAAAIIYTSGTTGSPKAVELTHQNILTNLDGVRPVLRFGPDDVFLSLLPLHHTLEATCGFLMPLMSGATIVYGRSFKSRDIFEDVARNGVTLMVNVPLLYEKMHHTFLRRIRDAGLARTVLFRALLGLSSVGWALGLRWGKPLFRSLRERIGMKTVRMFVTGGAPVPPRTARFFNLIGVDFQPGYGLTECSPVVSVNSPGNTRFGSVGPPIANVEVAIDNPDRSGVGEILVRGGNVTPGYRGNPQGTAELIRDGWLYTGDLGRLQGGHLWITGRKKNVIVSAAGKNIYPEELEEKLLEHDCILEVVVFGRCKQNKQGEDVRALVVPDLEQLAATENITPERPDMDKLRDAIHRVIGEVNNRVAAYKRIAGFDVQLGELEKTSTRKVKRYLYK